LLESLGPLNRAIESFKKQFCNAAENKPNLNVESFDTEAEDEQRSDVEITS